MVRGYCVCVFRTVKKWSVLVAFLVEILVAILVAIPLTILHVLDLD